MTSTTGIDMTNQEIYNSLNKKKLVIRFLIFIVLILLSIISCLLVIMFMYGVQNVCAHEIQNEVMNLTKSENEGIPPPSGNSTLSGKLKIIPRIDWLAQPPEHPPDPLRLPVPYVIILHTASEGCTDQAKCTALVRHIQNFHVESKGWWDIGYNFLVGGDGYVYEGRGWKGIGAHVYGWNAKSISIAFIGSFNKILPTSQQILAGKMLIQKGLEEGYIEKDYKLFAQRQLSSTQSPGEAFYENIKTWPHWAEKPDEETS